MIIDIWVPGKPVPKGSASSFHHPHAKDKKGNPLIITRQSNAAKQKPWAAAIEIRAEQAMGLERMTQDAVEVDVAFHFKRPKTHLRVDGKTLRKGYAEAHLQEPDLDKLLRCVCDALTGIVWCDDRQVNAVFARKVWSLEREGVRICVSKSQS